MKLAVTGCAGFIGSNLVDRLLIDGYEVVGIDNFSTGKKPFLNGALNNKNFRLLNGDLLDKNFLSDAFNGCNIVFHFSANADVRRGTDFPSKDLEQNTIATFNVLDAMRSSGVKKIVFSSTGSVYGEAEVIPTPENAPFPVQTSLYGASKIAGEALISAYCEGFGFQAWIFRFVSILGERYTHGHIFDFYRQLKINPSVLKVLGDGTQKKSYLHVQDCIDAILNALEVTNKKVNIFNLGVDGYCEVNDSIGWICDELGLNPSIEYSGGSRGWIGDNPYIFLDTKKIKNTGWHARSSIEDGVRNTVRYLQKNEWVFESGDQT
jgi:UDP-glucose 4-epimerase